MAREIALPWGNNQVDFDLTEETVGLSFTTPATMPKRGIVWLKVFEIGGSPPSLMMAVFNQSLGSLAAPLLVCQSSVAVDCGLTVAETPPRKPGHPPKPAQLQPSTKYYLNIESEDNSQPSFKKRATIKIPG